MKPITIVGGGLAGLTLGIGLRQRGVPVSIWEAGGYPRHRVCGEFISGRGVDSLAGLGLAEKLLQAGARVARTAAFFSERSARPPKALPQPALCLSRHALDASLAREFCRLGGGLHEQTRWRDHEFGEGVVRATGRRISPVVDGWRWFGLKVHARNVRLQADLEMHLVRGGYVGLCQLADGVVNVCGLFRSRAAQPELSGHWREFLCRRPGSWLDRRLADASFDENSFCAVAGLSLHPQRAAAHAECCVGDAITMIPPVTGNGMSMAFESAACAIEPAAAYSRGVLSWAEAQRTIARQCDGCFRRRLVWARWLEWALLQRGLRETLIGLASRSDWAWSVLFARTR